MSEPMAKRRPMIDLEEFERRLRRSSGVNQWDSRPLVERAGLADGQMDLHQTVFEPQGQHWAHLRQDAWEPVGRKEPRLGERFINGDFAAIEAGLLGAARQGVAVEPSSAARGDSDPGERLIKGDFAAIEAALLGAREHEAAAAPQAEESVVFPSVDDRSEHWHYTGDAVASRPVDVTDEEGRSRFPLYVMAAVIIVGIAGIAASFGSKSRVSSVVSAPSEPAIVEAETRPTKLQTETASNAEVPTENVFVPSRMPEPAPTAFANSVEQAVDASPEQENRETPPSVAALDSSPGTEGAGLATKVAAPPPAQAEQPSITALIEQQKIEPQKMRTASIRSDGALPRNNAPAHATGTPLPAPRPTDSVKATTANKASTAKAPVHTVKTQKPATAAELGGHRQPTPAASHPAPAKPPASAAAAAKPVVQLADGQATGAGTPAAQPKPAPDGAFGFIQHAVNSIATTTDKLLEWGGIGAGAHP